VDNLDQSQSIHILLTRGFAVVLLGVIAFTARKNKIEVEKIGKAGILAILKEYIEKDEN